MSSHREDTFELLYEQSRRVLKANYEQGVIQTEAVMEAIKVLRSNKPDRAEIAAKMLEHAWSP